MAKLQTTPVVTIYKLSDLFARISEKIADYEAQLADVPAEQQDRYPSPKPSKDALERINAEIADWQSRGFEYAATGRPFSDDNITGRIEDALTSQFGSIAFPDRKEICKVKPLDNATVRALWLSI